MNYTIPFESRSVQVQDIAFKLEYTSFIKHMDSEEIEDELLESLELQKPKEDALYSMITTFTDKSVPISTDQPWIIDFLSTLLYCCRYGESDLLDHPLGVILVVSSDDPDPIHRFNELAQRVLSRKCYSQRAYTPSIPFFYFLVHTNDSSANVDTIYNNMKSSFNASHCKIIRINSLSETQKRKVSPFPEHCALP